MNGKTSETLSCSLQLGIILHAVYFMAIRVHCHGFIKNQQDNKSLHIYLFSYNALSNSAIMPRIKQFIRLEQ